MTDAVKSILGLRAPRAQFQLPPEGTLQPSGPSDPLRSYYQPLSGFLYRERIRLALSLLTPPYDEILELGYGSGILMPSLAAIGRRVYGVDLDADPAHVQANLSRLDVHPVLLRGDASRPPFPDSSFDLIIALSIFEHMPEHRSVMRAVVRLLKSGGHLLVGMPRVDRLMEMLFPFLGYQNIQDRHVSTYKQFLRVAQEDLELTKFARMPQWLPTPAGLYFVMLLRKW